MSAPLQIIAGVLGSEDKAQQIIGALEAAGYVCVPAEPTPEMIESGWAAATAENAADVWRDMIESARLGRSLWRK